MTWTHGHGKRKRRLQNRPRNEVRPATVGYVFCHRREEEERVCVCTCMQHKSFLLEYPP